MTAEFRFNRRGVRTLEIRAYTSNTNIPAREEPISLVLTSETEGHLRIVMTEEEARSLGEQLSIHGHRPR